MALRTLHKADIIVIDKSVSPQGPFSGCCGAFCRWSSPSCHDIAQILISIFVSAVLVSNAADQLLNGPCSEIVFSAVVSKVKYKLSVSVFVIFFSVNACSGRNDFNTALALELSGSIRHNSSDILDFET